MSMITRAWWIAPALVAIAGFIAPANGG